MNGLIGRIRKALVRAYARSVIEGDPEILVAHAANDTLKVARLMPRTRQIVVDIPLGLPWWLGGGACTAKFTAYSTDRTIRDGGTVEDSVFSVEVAQ